MDKFNDFQRLCYRVFYENLDIKEFERFIYDEAYRWIVNDDELYIINNIKPKIYYN